jgi:hypothetical protein
VGTLEEVCVQAVDVVEKVGQVVAHEFEQVPVRLHSTTSIKGFKSEPKRRPRGRGGPRATYGLVTNVDHEPVAGVLHDFFGGHAQHLRRTSSHHHPHHRPRVGTTKLGQSPFCFSSLFCSSLRFALLLGGVREELGGGQTLEAAATMS